MALTELTVHAATLLFRDINPELESWSIYRDDEAMRIDRIIGYGPKDDGSMDEFFINVKNITPEQLAKWEEHRHGVLGRSFNRDMGKGITRLGFF